MDMTFELLNINFLTLTFSMLYHVQKHLYQKLNEKVKCLKNLNFLIVILNLLVTEPRSLQIKKHLNVRRLRKEEKYN